MKGISPVVSIVLVIALAIIVTMGVYFWAAGLTTKPDLDPPHLYEINAEFEDYTTGQIRVYNIDTVNIGAQTMHIAGSSSTCTITALSPGDSAVCNIGSAVYDEVTIYGDNTTAVTLIAPAS